MSLNTQISILWFLEWYFIIIFAVSIIVSVIVTSFDIKIVKRPKKWFMTIAIIAFLSALLGYSIDEVHSHKEKQLGDLRKDYNVYYNNEIASVSKVKGSDITEIYCGDYCVEIPSYNSDHYEIIYDDVNRVVTINDKI